jgi:chloramphenicol 3-O-phosphotransferase
MNIYTQPTKDLNGKKLFKVGDFITLESAMNSHELGITVIVNDGINVSVGMEE